jgi:glycosyltransferase involved in cell wall biosynthesis
MKILLIHNRYLFRGGEDYVFEREKKLLENNHTTETLIFDNSSKSLFKIFFPNIFKLFYNPDAVKTLKRKIEEFSPDVIHVHNFFPIATPSIFILARNMHIPLVLTLHNYRTICCNGMLLRNNRPCIKCIKNKIPLSGIMYKCYRKSILLSLCVTSIMSVHKLVGTWDNCINKYIVLTNFGKKLFLSSSLLSKSKHHKIIVKSNFIEDAGVGNISRDNYYLFVGRLSEEKGINVLLAALEHYRFPLKIIGEGPLENKLKNCIIGKEDVLYLGKQQPETVRNEMKKAKALLFPSIWYEGQPLTVIEALSTGTPVICSDIGAVADIITNHQNGIHFRFGDAKDLAEKIKEFDMFKMEKEAMYKSARDTYSEKFTPIKNLEALEEIYRDVLASTDS